MKYHLSSPVYFLFSFFLFISLQVFAENKNCVTKSHALYDVGSGSTKLTVLKIDSCNGLPEVLLKTSEKVDYKDDLLKSKEAEFSEEIQKKGFEALAKLKGEADKLKAESSKGIATAAFREAKNAQDVLNTFNKKLKLNIEVITQDQEAQLAYQAVRLHNKDKNLLVWDIGGGSFQMTYLDEPKQEWHIYKGKLAAVSFKDHIIKEIKKKDGLKSPNPFSLSEIKKARSFVRKALSSSFKESYISGKSFKNVVGVGGVLSISVSKHLDKKSFTDKDIDEWLMKNHHKTDEDLKDNYADTVISSMILVSEMMKLMKIREVKAHDVSIVEGLL
jgi:exopolyphosphatase/guanosine-5'-triphosphate,3'-diphosphate pyrophosphatase